MRIFKFLPIFVLVSKLVFSENLNNSQMPSNLDLGLKECQIKPSYNASTIVQTKCCCPIFVSADFLYWQAREDNLSYAIKLPLPVLPSTDIKVINMNFKWHPGVKIGIGGNFPKHGDWNILLEWTHLISHNNTSVSSQITGTVFTSQFMTTTIAGSNVDSGRASWKLIYNTIDFNIGRPMYVGKMLSFRPHAGLRSAWFEQHENLIYTLATSDPEGLFLPLHLKMHSWGIGPRLGIETKWFLGMGFKFLGNVALSMLYTYFNMHKDEKISFINGTELNDTSLNDKTRNSQVRPNTEIFLGLGWGEYFNQRMSHLELSVGYEFQYWWDVNSNDRVVSFSAPGILVSGGSLSLQGITVKARFDF